MIHLLRQQLFRDEGKRNHLYLDTRGKWTIGIGRNLTDKGLSDNEIETLFTNDLNEALYGVKRALPWVEELDDARLGVLVNMAFQMGLGGLLSFKRMLSYIRVHNYTRAYEEMIDSKWATQTPSRAYRLAKQMETGEWQ